MGLLECDAVVDAVRAGFIVHGFEPAPNHYALCHKKLPAKLRYDAPVAQLASGELAATNWWATQRTVLQNSMRHRKRKSKWDLGFAFLYQAALSNASAYPGLNFTVGAGGSSSLHMPVEEAISHGKSAASVRRVTVPVLRLDQSVDDDLWLLKMDTQGNEANVLAGATHLFARRTVAHVFTEFDPRLIRRAGNRPREVLERLHAAGFFCLDARNPLTAPWSLGTKHPLGADEFIDAMDRHEANALRMSPPPKWATNFGAFDDLACANIAKVWRPASAERADKAHEV